MRKWIKFGMCGLAALGVLTVSQLPVKAEYTAEEKKQIEDLKKSYPLTTCPVSGEKLEKTAMGDPVDYLYKQKMADGMEITRLVRFCCPDCIKKFAKDPAKYLKTIDDAAAKNASTAPAPSSSGGSMSGMDHSSMGGADHAGCH